MHPRATDVADVSLAFATPARIASSNPSGEVALISTTLATDTVPPSSLLQSPHLTHRRGAAHRHGLRVAVRGYYVPTGGYSHDGNDEPGTCGVVRMNVWAGRRTLNPCNARLVTCPHCRIVVGVYEPVIVVFADESEVETSLLAIGDDSGGIESVWHRHCRRPRLRTPSVAPAPLCVLAVDSGPVRRSPGAQAGQPPMTRVGPNATLRSCPAAVFASLVSRASPWESARSG